MKSQYLLFTIVAFFWVAIAGAEELNISMTEPADGSKVANRNYVKGIISNPNAEVWVVIHPVDTSGFWIQPSVTVKNSGSWKVKAYFGRSGSIDSGKEFEIRAFANPTGTFREGKTHGWPKAAARSDVVDVTRE